MLSHQLNVVILNPQYLILQTDSSELRSWLAKWLLGFETLTYMQVLDQQLVSMCEGIQSDLPYPTKCEEVVHSKQNNV